MDNVNKINDRIKEVWNGLTTQARIIFVLYGLVLIYVLYMNAKRSMTTLITVGMIMILTMVYYTYMVNCLTVGHCDILAWILAIAAIITFLLQARL